MSMTMTMTMTKNKIQDQSFRAYCPIYTVSDGVTSFSKKSSNAGRLYEIYAQGSRLFLYVRSAL